MKFQSQTRASLEQALVQPRDFIGTIGVAYPFVLVPGMNFHLNVRVLDEDRRLLTHAPYSLSFSSSCCSSGIRADYTVEDVLAGLKCDECGTDQAWLPTRERLSVMGRGRDYSKSLIVQALEARFSMDPLESAFLAEAMLHDIELVREEFLTPAWAAYMAEQSWDYYGRPEAS